MGKYVFEPRLEVLGEYSPTASIEDISQEVGMYSCSPDFVMENGGPLTKMMVEKIPSDWFEDAKRLGLYPNIDVRVHRLYQGDYPAVPGWHCDGEYRKDYYSQPELDKVVPHRHIVGTLSSEDSGVSLTEFVNEPFVVSIDESTDSDAGVWEQVHKAVEEEGLSTVSAEDGKLYEFGSFTLHRVTPAARRGWRLFVRASMWHKPYLSGEGTIARQEYVYRLSEEKGW